MQSAEMMKRVAERELRHVLLKQEGKELILRLSLQQRSQSLELVNEAKERIEQLIAEFFPR